MLWDDDCNVCGMRCQTERSVMNCEMPKVCIRKEVRARKTHVRCECRKQIVIKSIYVRYSGIWDKPETFKLCVRCDKLKDLALKKYQPYFEEEGPGFGFLREWLRECRR